MIQNQNMHQAAVEALWDGVDHAEIFERGRYFKGGFEGVIQVKRTIVKDTRKNGLAFIVEFEVLSSNMSEHHANGSKGTWYQGLRSKDIAFPEIAAWVAACAGYRRDQKTEIDEKVRPLIKEMLVEATLKPDENMFTNIKLQLRTYMKKTKERGVDFTVHEFEPYYEPKN
jgi:hypothetical protein